MTASQDGAPEKHQVRRAFSRAAGGYNALAVLQRQVAQHLLAHLGQSALKPRRILDLGTGTGHCLPQLETLFPQARLIALDIAEGMLREVRQSCALGRDVWLVNGDAERLPLACASVDLIVSNLALQWCPDLRTALRECARVLAPGGALVFTTFGARTLAELRQAWAAIDNYSHVNRFVPEPVVREALFGAGLALSRFETELRVSVYPDVFALMRELKGLGAHNVTVNRLRTLTGKQRLFAMASRYPSIRREPAGEVPASFEVFFADARRVT
jgi:malonyl-CoA O-methyltransferase